ncbi:MAG: DUF3135 domain-containing protein [Gammaproteobacteria bacterium]|nr:DUF3135 domain-containing protein [Gammaproteobacteria bacterium]
MDNQLPDVSELIRLAKEDPEGLEQLRKKLCSQLIDNAPKHYQRRLKGLQFQIDMERRRSNNPLHSCIKISQMMLESYQSLQNALAKLAHAGEISVLKQSDKNQHHDGCSNQYSADIISFSKVSEKL